MSNYIDFIISYFKNSFKSYGIFDKNFNILNTNTDILKDDISADNIFVYDKNGIETDISVGGEKYGIIKHRDKLTAVSVTPLYYNSQTEGYSVEIIEPYELFGGEIVSRKNSGNIRQQVSSIVANNTVLKTTLENQELYDECSYIDNADKSSMRILSAVTNSETILSMFESRDCNEICDISEIINELLQVVKFSFGQKLLIKSNINDNLYADINKEQFVSAIMNLIVNAYQYNLSEIKEVTISLKKHDENIIFTIDDNGNGIDDSYAKCSVGTVKPLFNGKEGLGLTVVKLFATLHNGDVKIFSKGEGVGTSVRISIPSCKTDSKVTMSGVKNYIKNRFSTLYLVLEKADI